MKVIARTILIAALCGIFYAIATQTDWLCDPAYPEFQQCLESR